MMVQLYYATGHQPTLTGLRLEAGFVGQHGEMTRYKLVLAGLLVGLQTVAAQVCPHNIISSDVVSPTDNIGLDGTTTDHLALQR